MVLAFSHFSTFHTPRDTDSEHIYRVEMGSILLFKSITVLLHFQDNFKINDHVSKEFRGP